MPKKSLPRIPEELKNQAFDVLCEFGSARRRAFIKYICFIIEQSGLIGEEYLPRTVEIADQLLQSLQYNKRILIIKYANEVIVMPIHGKVSFEAMEAFEAYTKIVEELSENDVKYWACHASTAGYPYDFVFGTPETAYRVLIYGTDATGRLNFMNAAYKPTDDRDYTTLFIVTEAYATEDFSSMGIKGKFRLALIVPDGKDKICILGPLNKNGVM